MHRMQIPVGDYRVSRSESSPAATLTQAEAWLLQAMPHHLGMASIDLFPDASSLYFQGHTHTYTAQLARLPNVSQAHAIIDLALTVCVCIANGE